MNLFVMGFCASEVDSTYSPMRISREEVVVWRLCFCIVTIRTRNITGGPPPAPNPLKGSLSVDDSCFDLETGGAEPSTEKGKF